VIAAAESAAPESVGSRDVRSSGEEVLSFIARRR
jgi:hypothetical protein